MKKRLLILSSLLAVGGLSGCDLFGGGGDINEDDWLVVPEFDSGKKAEKLAILEAINNRSVCIDRSGNDFFPTDANIVLEEDNGDYISVATKVVVDKYTVELTWDFNESQATFAKKTANEKGYLVNIKYPGFGYPDSTFTWSLTKIVCGSAVSTNTKSNYSATVKAASVSYTPMTLADIYKNHSEDKTVSIDGKSYTYHSWNELVNYEAKNTKGYSPWWNTGRPSDSDNNYIYAEISGKVLFLSDDGNWGLLADGDRIMEIYSGNQLDLNSRKYPDLVVGNYVTIRGEVNHYYGNFQFSYINSITACDKSKVTEPSGNFKALTASLLSSIELKAGSIKADNSNVEVTPQYKQFPVELLHNDLVTVTGKVVSNRKDGGSGRFTFYVEVGGHLVQIAYDYHTDKNDSRVGNALKQVISLGSTVTIKGTYRFNHGADKTLVPTTCAGGEITVVPFEVSHIG